MTDREKLALIYRLTTGYTHMGKYIIDTPSEGLLNYSFSYYNNLIKKNRFEDFLIKDHIPFILIKNKLWSFNINAEIGSDEEIKELAKSLDDAKFRLYDNWGNPKEIKKIRIQLDLIRKRQNRLLNTKHMLDKFTLEGFAEELTELFVFSKLVLNTQYKRVKLGKSKLEYLMSKYRELSPSLEQIRLIARSEPWLSFWESDVEFRVNSDGQKMLKMFTKMYKNVNEHQEKPPQDIINDDDALDGWFIWLKKNEGKEKKKLHNIPANATEVFFFPHNEDGSFSPQMAKEIDDLNDERAKIIKGKIMQGVKTGPITDLDIPELKIDALMKARSKNG